MPKYVPEWAYGKFIIVPIAVNKWIVKEKTWFPFFKLVFYGYNPDYGLLTIKTFNSLETAKEEIDKIIRWREDEKIKRYNEKLWMKENKPIDYP